MTRLVFNCSVVGWGLGQCQWLCDRVQVYMRDEQLYDEITMYYLSCIAKFVFGLIVYGRCRVSRQTRSASL